MYFTQKNKPLVLQILRVSEDERKSIKKAAARYKISVSQFIRGSIQKQLIEEKLIK